MAPPSILLVGLLLSASKGVCSSPLPDWIHAANAQKLPSYPAATRAVVLLDEETYTVASDGRATEHIRRVVRILRPQGRRDARPFVWYDNLSKITSMHVWSIDPAGHEYTVKDNEIVDLGTSGEAGELYSDERARAANPPGLDPGGIVALEYERRVRPYISEADWFFQEDVPHLNQSFTLVLPQGFRFTSSWSHHERVQPTELPNNSLRWQIEDEPGIDLAETPMAPSEMALAGRLAVHYSGPEASPAKEGTWKGIGLWYEGLAQDRTSASPEIQAKAIALTAGKADFYEKAEAIGEFIQQNIRYFAVEIGIGGNQPHFASDIYKGRYGDCKDKATLLRAMLSSVGIGSAYVMVDTNRGVITPDDPSIVGNHMIAAIEIPSGYQNPKMHSVVKAQSGKRYLIFDPTWEMTPFGQLEANLQGGYGLLVAGQESQVIALPVLDPALNRVERSGTFQLTPDGELKGTVVEKRSGDLAMRRRYAFQRDEQARQKYLDRVASRDFTSVSLTDLKIENVSTLSKDLTLEYKLDAGHFATSTGPLLMVRPRVVGSEELYVNHRRREVPVDLQETMQVKDSFDIDLPDGYTMDELPDPVKLDLGFASYESSTELRGHTMHYSRTYSLRQVTLPADKYPELQKLAGVIAADEENRAVLKHTN